MWSEYVIRGLNNASYANIKAFPEEEESLKHNWWEVYTATNKSQLIHTS